MSRKIARITQDKKLLLANEVVEDNAKTSLNSDGRLNTDEIIEYPAELEGGRNLALIKDYSHDNQYQTVTKTDETFNGQPVYRAIKKTTGTPPTSIGSITIRKGETFTASIWIKHEQQPTMETARLIFYKNGVLKSVYAKNNYGEWERLIVTYTNNTDADIENVYIYFYPARGVGDVTYFTCPKIEEGSQATPWTPAPEDLGLNYPDSIQNFNSSISGNNIIVPEFIEGYPFVKPVIDDSLVLWFDGTTGNNYEQTGTWKDLSGNGNHGQLMNFGYTEGSGWVDGGLKFDGVDDIVMVPNFNPSIFNNQFTFEMVINISKLMAEGSGYYNNVAGFTSSKKDVHFIINLWERNRISINLINNNSQIAILTLANSLILNKKIHIMCKYDGREIDFFINGSKVDLQADDTTIRFLADYDCLVVGGRRTFSRGYYDGSIYSTRLYNRALTDEEILQNYRAGQCSPLLAMRGDV